MNTRGGKVHVRELGRFWTCESELRPKAVYCNLRMYELDKFWTCDK